MPPRREFFRKLDKYMLYKVASGKHTFYEVRDWSGQRSHVFSDLSKAFEWIAKEK